MSRKSESPTIVPKPVPDSDADANGTAHVTVGIKLDISEFDGDAADGFIEDSPDTSHNITNGQFSDQEFAASITRDNVATKSKMPFLKPDVSQRKSVLDPKKFRKKKPEVGRQKSRSISPVPEFNPSPDDPYDYDADEHYFDNKEIELPFENMEQFEDCFTVMPPGEKRFVLDNMMHAANVMFGEYRRLNGQLRALNARSGRINKQVQREAEVVASGSDPRLAPRSSKNLNTSVVEAVIHLGDVEAEKILSKKKVTPTMRALLKSRREGNHTSLFPNGDVKMEVDALE